MQRLMVALSLVLVMSLTPAMCGATVPTPIIDVGFNEGSGTVAVNSGSAGGELALTTPVPTWSNNVPAGVGGLSSVDFGTTYANYCVESPANYSQLTGLTKFTVTGWVNCRNSTEGSGGNRLVTWINHGGEGVDVVYKSNGSVQVGIDQWPDGVPAQSSAGKIPTDAAAGVDNWRFFAVTYDSTLGQRPCEVLLWQQYGNLPRSMWQEIMLAGLWERASAVCASATSMLPPAARRSTACSAG